MRLNIYCINNWHNPPYSKYEHLKFGAYRFSLSRGFVSGSKRARRFIRASWVAIYRLCAVLCKLGMNDWRWVRSKVGRCMKLKKQIGNP